MIGGGSARPFGVRPLPYNPAQRQLFRSETEPGVLPGTVTVTRTATC